MTIWVDAQLPPALAPWIKEQFDIDAYSAKWLGFRDATDHEIFLGARKEEAVVMTKDRDFVTLLERHGAPPQVLLITIRNTSNAEMRKILQTSLPKAIVLLNLGEPLVEIGELEP